MIKHSILAKGEESEPGLYNVNRIEIKFEQSDTLYILYGTMRDILAYNKAFSDILKVSTALGFPHSHDPNDTAILVYPTTAVRPLFYMSDEEFIQFLSQVPESIHKQISNIVDVWAPDDTMFSDPSERI